MLQNTPTVYLSRLASPSLQRFLQSNGFQLKSLDVPVVYPEISTHADILLCQLGLWEKAQIFHGDPEKLTRNYPGNIRYNAVCTGKYFIHNLQYTDPDLLAAAEAKAAADSTILTKIHVKQGYTRCSLLPVDDRSFITSDAGIAKTLAVHDTDVLLIHPGHIYLPGFEYGFIGGTGGGLPLSGRRLLVVNGNIETHPDHKNRDLPRRSRYRLILLEGQPTDGYRQHPRRRRTEAFAAASPGLICSRNRHPGLSAFSYATPAILSPYGCTFFWKASRLCPRDMRTRGRSSGLSPGLALPG